MAALDYYSDACHRQIIEIFTSNEGIGRLPAYDDKTLEKHIRNPGETTLRMIEASAADLNISMARFAISVIRYYEQKPDPSPTALWEPLLRDLESILEKMAARHGPTRPYEYAVFYCGLIVVVNLTAGVRIKLEDTHQFSNPLTDATAMRLMLSVGNSTFEFMYNPAWLPSEMTTGAEPAPEVDTQFKSARRRAEKYVEEQGKMCAVTELGFGFPDVNVSVLVCFTEIGTSLPADFFGSRPFFHSPGTIENLISTTAGAAASNQIPEGSTPNAERMLALITASFDGWFKQNKHVLFGDLAPINMALARSKYLSTLRNQAKDSISEDTAKSLKEVRLGHGASISLEDQLSRASFGLHVESEAWSQAGIYPFLTAAHVAPSPDIVSEFPPAPGARVQSPGGLDIIKPVLSELKYSKDCFQWKNGPEKAEKICLEAFANREIIGRVFDRSELGAEKPPGVGSPRLDYSIVTLTNPEQARVRRNGFSFLSERELAKLSELVLEGFRRSGMEDNEPELFSEVEDVFGKTPYEVFGYLHDIATYPAQGEGDEHVFKAGATTGVTTGVVSGRRLYLYRKHASPMPALDNPNESMDSDTMMSRAESLAPAKVDARLFTMIRSNTEDPSPFGGFKHFCASGDSGSGVLKVVRISKGVWRLCWAGLLVSMVRDLKIGDGVAWGLMVPAEVVVEQIKAVTGQTVRPSP